MTDTVECPGCGERFVPAVSPVDTLARLRAQCADQKIWILANDTVYPKECGMLIRRTEKTLSNWRLLAKPPLESTRLGSNGAVVYRLTAIADYLDGPKVGDGDI